jgi:thiol-disulfide isomerase/thioredoxin
MHFEHDLSWSDILAKAKAGNKYIFVDCFTTWCGPCKFMSANVFPREEAGTYFNDKFINVKVQLDTTAKDDAHVKAWYADAHALMTDYHIRAFPTYLIFTPDGKAVDRLVGSRGDALGFIADVKVCFDTSKQYYTQLAEFKQGRRDSAFLHHLAVQASDLYILSDAGPIANAWFATQPTLYTPACLKLMGDMTTSTADAGFDIFLHHADEADVVLKYGAKATPGDLNSFAWAVFQDCPDMTCVADALEWSKRSFKDNNDPGYMDTYANILYKLGRKDEAITWEQKAHDLASSDGEKAGYQATIDKMKKGEKTWN